MTGIKNKIKSASPSVNKKKEKCAHPGIEPGISGLRDQRLYHSATGACMVRQTSDTILSGIQFIIY